MATLMTLVSDAHAGIIPVQPVTHVNSVFLPGESFRREPPQVVALADGGFVVIWDAAGDFAPAFGRHFDADGQVVGEQFQFEGVFGRGAAASHGDGLVMPFSAESGAMLGSFTADGVLKSAARIEAFPSSIAATPSDGLVSVWSPDTEVVAQQFAMDLLPSGPSFVVSAESPYNEYLQVPTVATDSTGGFVSVWWAENSSALWGRRFDAQNVPIAEMFPVVAPGRLGDLTAPPQACISEGGDFVVAWGDYDHPPQFRQFDKAGTPLTPPLVNAIGVSLACLSRGRFVVAGVNLPSGMALRAFDAQMRPFGQFILPIADPGVGPTVTRLIDETFVATWNSCFAGAAPGCDVYARRFALTESPDCSGDCDGNGLVTIDEITRALALALSDYPDASIRCEHIEYCPSIDTDLDCEVSITELVAAVGHALTGCG